jgi:hypothetical protein
MIDRLAGDDDDVIVGVWLTAGTKGLMSVIPS